MSCAAGPRAVRSDHKAFKLGRQQTLGKLGEILQPWYRVMVGLEGMEERINAEHQRQSELMNDDKKAADPSR